jgi:membrane-associated phospholipid phosphatase
MRNPTAVLACFGFLLAPLGAQAQSPAIAPSLERWTPGWTPPVQGPPGFPMPMPAAEPPSRRALQWWHAAIAAGVLGGVALLDEPTRDGVQDVRTTGSNDLARAARHFGQPEVYGTVALGTIAVGLVAGKPEVRRAGERIAASLLVAAAATSGLKIAFGRERPSSNSDAFDFDPPKTDASFPSGHTTVAFALATSVSDEVHRTPVTIALYGAAALTGWSRLNDNKHWLSDVVGGAAVGIASAKLMDGHWKVFGLSAPRFLLTPDRAGVAMAF